METPSVTRITSARIPTDYGEFQLVCYSNTLDEKDHLAFCMGEDFSGGDTLVRVHSECLTGDIFGSRRCDCGEQLDRALQLIAEEGRGVLIYLRQEGRGIGLMEKMRAYNLQDEGHDTVDANLILGHGADERSYALASCVLKDLGVSSARLITNNPDKISALEADGIKVSDRVALPSTVHSENSRYLMTKVERMNHMMRPPTHRDRPRRVTSLNLKQEIEDWLNDRVASFQSDSRPFITLSYAQSWDGSITTHSGESLSISGEESMQITHQLRSLHDGILVGIGTVISDDPQLTVREWPGSNPQPIILDSQVRTPASAKLCSHPDKQCWVITANADAESPNGNLEVLTVHNNSVDSQHASLHAAMKLLNERGIERLMVEGGANVITGFLQARLVDAVVLTIGPKLVGGYKAVGDLQPKVGNSVLDINPLYSGQAGQDLIVWGELRYDDTEA